MLLSDFGIATIAHSTSSLSASAEGTSGTLAYMAPEQIEGHPRPASDQYALRVVVYPGYDPNAGCPPFDPTAANKLLDDNGWVKGPDGVRTKGNERLEFELSTNDNQPARIDTEVIVQHNLSVIGIKLDIQNYAPGTFFGPFLNGGKSSPPTGAVAGRFDITEVANGPGNYDPDDSGFVSCDQYYCNHALDALYKQEQETLDPVLRQQIFQQIHQIYLTDIPFITLFFPLDEAIMHKGTHNYQPSPFVGETVNIWEWWCDNGKC